MKSRRRSSAALFALILWMAFLSMVAPATPARADGSGPMPKDITILPHLGQKLPLQTPFSDEDGREVLLGDYFGKRPVVMVLAYYECPMLCSMVLNGLMLGLRKTELAPGRDFEVVVVSIDPADTPQRAAAKKAAYVSLLRRPGGDESLHFLTGKEPEIAGIADTLGFRYEYDPIGKQYAHAAGAVVLAPDGTISRYFYGVDFAPTDLRLGLVDAANGKLGSLGDRLLLLCYRYDPERGKYAPFALGAVRVFGALTAAVLGISIFLLHRRKGSVGRPGGREP